MQTINAGHSTISIITSELGNMFFTDQDDNTVLLRPMGGFIVGQMFPKAGNMSNVGKFDRWDEAENAAILALSDVEAEDEGDEALDWLFDAANGRQDEGSGDDERLWRLQRQLDIDESMLVVGTDCQFDR